ncbi:hypothetical protein D3C79_891130 [compost metagenome]
MVNAGDYLIDRSIRAQWVVQQGDVIAACTQRRGDKAKLCLVPRLPVAGVQIDQVGFGGAFGKAHVQGLPGM